MTTFCENIMPANLVKSETLLNIVMPRAAIRTESKQNIVATAYKAGFPFDDSTSVVSRFLAELGSLASLCIFTTNFFRTCQEPEKLAQAHKVCLMLRLTPVIALIISFPSQIERSQSCFRNYHRTSYSNSPRCFVSFS